MSRPRKTATAIALVFGLAGFPLVAQSANSPTLSKRSVKPVAYGAPVLFRIPRLGIKAAVEKTSIDSKGQLAAPRDPKKVGWYRNGTIPGKRGNALIAGHVDWYDGPAVFWKLRSIRRGDVVEVVNDYGQVLRFRVVATGAYKNGSLPMDRMVRKTRAFHLNLYTCGGAFNRTERNYSHRVVVFTELIR
ncbi:MAG: class F sortase [Candidatus Kerfeldbacteria bacterium]|nr:class F sortase [Candidatus Kerfeldbacteria bacterium]